MPQSTRVPVLLAAFLVVLVAAGCDGAGTAPNVTATGAADTPSSAPGTSVSVAGRSYTAAGLDLCARTDLKPLADLTLTVTRTDPKPPAGRPGAACLFEMRTEQGHQANLRVEASTPLTADEARLLYSATRQTTGMTPAGAVAGVEGEAEAFTKRSTPGFAYAEYMIHARTGNLVVKVWLALGGDSHASTSTLAAPSLTILKATQAAVPRV